MHGAVALGLLHVASAAVTSWSGALDPSYDPCNLSEWSCDICEWADVHEIEAPRAVALRCDVCSPSLASKAKRG